jgi:hypothetical protein
MGSRGGGIECVRFEKHEVDKVAKDRDHKKISSRFAVELV